MYKISLSTLRPNHRKGGPQLISLFSVMILCMKKITVLHANIQGTPLAVKPDSLLLCSRNLLERLLVEPT